MKYYFCLVNEKDRTNGTNIGKTYAYQNRSKWVEAHESIKDFLTVGYVKGVDHVVVNGKVYALMKTYIDTDDDFIVFVCVESVSGCDN